MPSTHKTVRAILQLAAGATLLIGIVTLIAPNAVVGWFDGFDGQNQHFVRFIGTALIGFSVSNWLYSRLVDLSHVLPAIYGNLASLVLAIIVDLVGLQQKMLSKAAWLIAALHSVFAFAFLYCVILIHKTKK